MRVVVSRFGRVTLVVVAVLFLITLLSFAQPSSFADTIPKTKELWHSTVHKANSENATVPEHGVSYDLTTPPSYGCESLVNDLQQRLIRAYTQRFKGIRYANIWGYLETENKGDAAIWSAQQMLLSILGIETMEACRYDLCTLILRIPDSFFVAQRHMLTWPCLTASSTRVAMSTNLLGSSTSTALTQPSSWPVVATLTTTTGRTSRHG